MNGRYVAVFNDNNGDMIHIRGHEARYPFALKS